MTDWFEEKLEEKLGRIIKVQVRRKIVSHRSRYQKIEIFDTVPFGRMLVHDDVIMLTEFDEANYHEMIAHVPLHVHPDPENVLIIGGGDGGTLREVLKHAGVRKVDLCEIDRDVVDLCKTHLPSLSGGYTDPRVDVFYEDGARFVAERKDRYQIILVDSSDPIGPAEVLFQESFYRDMHAALTRDGIVATQSESFLYHGDIIKKIARFSREIFPVYAYYHTQVPTYPSGTIGFSFCSKRYHPLEDIRENVGLAADRLTFYSNAVHRAAFVLPPFFERLLAK